MSYREINPIIVSYDNDISGTNQNNVNVNNLSNKSTEHQHSAEGKDEHFLQAACLNVCGLKRKTLYNLNFKN